MSNSTTPGRNPGVRGGMSDAHKQLSEMASGRELSAANLACNLLISPTLITSYIMECFISRGLELALSLGALPR